MRVGTLPVKSHSLGYWISSPVEGLQRSSMMLVPLAAGVLDDDDDGKLLETCWGFH